MEPLIEFVRGVPTSTNLPGELQLALHVIPHQTPPLPQKFLIGFGWRLAQEDHWCRPCTHVPAICNKRHTGDGICPRCKNTGWRGSVDAVGCQLCGTIECEYCVTCVPWLLLIFSTRGSLADIVCQSP